MKSSARKARTRIRRPRYLSLRLQLSPAPEPALPPPPTGATYSQKQLKKLFPDLHPDSTMAAQPLEDRDHDSNMARFFATMDGCGAAAAATLTGLLDTELGSSGATTTVSPPLTMEEEEVEESGSVSPPASCYFGSSSSSGGSGRPGQESLLERAALKSVRREEGEIRWVKMSEVVAAEDRNHKDQEEVSSCAHELAVAAGADEETWWSGRRRSSSAGGCGGRTPLLKLDYGEVLSAWSDKGGGPFCWIDVSGGSFGHDHDRDAQTVPDILLQQQSITVLHDDFPFHDKLSAVNVNGASTWRVPADWAAIVKGHRRSQQEISGTAMAVVARTEEEGQRFSGWQREARVLRYKEKRMNRLFSKRIRYQVRKLNAEKRPRVKGRFVKRS